MRVRRAVAVAVSVPVLAVSLAACGGGGEDSAGGGADKGGADRGGSQRGPGEDSGAGGAGGGSGRKESALEKRLAAALLKSGDVKGYRVERSKDDALPQQNKVKSKVPRCSAITDAMDSDPQRERKAFTNGVLQKGSQPASHGAVQQVMLAAYAKGEAQKWLAELKAAVRSCSSFSATDSAGKTVRLRVQRGPVDAVGDDSVQFELRVVRQPAPLVFTIVRSGGSTASFMSISLSGEPQPVETVLAQKQHQKLAAAGLG